MRFLGLYITLLVIGVGSVRAQTVYPGNGGAGFGGAIGGGSLSLSDDGTTLVGTLTRGSGGFNDGFVIYVDSIAGGATSTSGYTDTADGLRSAISGLNGADRAILNFPTSFAPDFAIAMSPAQNFGGLWSLSNPADFPFVSAISFAPPSDSTAGSYSFSISLTDLGLTANSGQSFDFVSTYVSFTAYRSNESIATTLTGTFASGDPNNNFGRNDVTAGNFATYTIIPEPSTVSLLALAGGLALFRVARARKKA